MNTTLNTTNALECSKEYLRTTSNSISDTINGNKFMGGSKSSQILPIQQQNEFKNKDNHVLSYGH